MLKVPQHVAIIMDGNRRWAKEHGISVLKGHLYGEERLEPIIDKAIELGISTLTFWAFSTENWHRNKKEVLFLISLFRKVLDKKVESYYKKNIKLNIIGDLSLFPSDIQAKAQKWIARTKNNKKIVVNIALSYGGRDEIIRAIDKWQKQSTGGSQQLPLTPQDFSQHLDTAGQPDPDLLIRTGGEKRLSGFLLWQIEYTELYFTDVYWPDFTPEEFVKAIKEYSRRQRRFGR
ncbi:di-trans,poly-cis-decaprenylcistransferase [Candidatus Gottesmanbacteria bacterium]|nr:di-trans,poly-cis-decaprenylcistransferase [Candidatus Gottesmanbacteria bacterium]